MCKLNINYNIIVIFNINIKSNNIFIYEINYKYLYILSKSIKL